MRGNNRGPPQTRRFALRHFDAARERAPQCSNPGVPLAIRPCAEDLGVRWLDAAFLSMPHTISNPSKQTVADCSGR